MLYLLLINVLTYLKKIPYQLLSYRIIATFANTHSLVVKSMPSKHMSRVRFPVCVNNTNSYFLLVLVLFLNRYK